MTKAVGLLLLSLVPWAVLVLWIVSAAVRVL